MKREIVIIGTLDTRGEDIKHIKTLIEERGHKAMVIDVGVLGEVPLEPNISRHQVAKRVGQAWMKLLLLIINQKQ